MNKLNRITLTKISVAISLFSVLGVAQANSLSVVGASAISFSGYSGQPSSTTGNYSSGFLGTLFANQSGMITFTYLGSESGYNNSFSFLGNTLTENNSVGDTTAPISIDPGAINFTFSDDQDGSFTNGAAATPTLGFAILDGSIAPTSGINYGPFDFVLAFNDSSFGDADYDDFVVGVNLSPISAVPLPASLPLMALSLGLFTATAARRKV